MRPPLTRGETGVTFAVGLFAAATAVAVAWAVMAPIPTPEPSEDVKVYNELTPGPWIVSAPTRLDIIMAPYSVEGRTVQERCDHFGGILDGARCIDVDY